MPSAREPRPPTPDPRPRRQAPDPRPPFLSPPFLFAGGGTGGHVIPALAVARELRSRGHSVFFVGTQRGMEAKLVPAEGFELKTISVGGLNRVSSWQKLKTLARLPITTLGCLRYAPAAVFSMGGYVAGPPVLAAILRRTPVVVMEPNAIAGFTNRAIGRFVSRALVSFEETARYFPRGRTEVTGLPVREEFFRIPVKPRGGALQVLITGGSQGSHTLNRAARQSWQRFRNANFPVYIVHQTGVRDFEEVRAEFAQAGIAGQVVPFIANMPEAFSAADLVISRSGAGTVSELAAAGRASILVPFPFAADDHQTRNAEAMQRGGAARVVRDSQFSGEKLFETVLELAKGPATLEKMAEAARHFAKPGAACRAADILEEAAGVK
jgi:UDP-N-acetylglucosamine--N-acetylmuramyl-(pentapeptide) pyrophosphoryl-undecaprenol N-acetylglucosamine transferase